MADVKSKLESLLGSKADDGVMRGSTKEFSIDNIQPLPNPKYKTPEQQKKDWDKARDDWNKSERKLPSGKFDDNVRPYKKGGKVKKYADGGQVQGQVQQPTYPFYGNQPQAGGQNGGVNQTFNMQPQANVDPNQQQQRFKKGGKVSSASKRADGCCIRGKTRA